MAYTLLRWRTFDFFLDFATFLQTSHFSFHSVRSIFTFADSKAARIDCENQRLIISERRVRRPQGKNGLVNLMNTQFCIFYLNRQTQMKADPRSPGVILRHRNKSIFRDKKTRKVENYIQERILSKNYINLTSRLLKKSYPLCLCRLWSHLNWKPIH